MLKKEQKELNIGINVIPDAPGHDYVQTSITVNGTHYVSKLVPWCVAVKWRKWVEVKAYKKLLAEFKIVFEKYYFERVTPYRDPAKVKQINLF